MARKIALLALVACMAVGTWRLTSRIMARHSIERRLQGFSTELLSERGRRAYETLRTAEMVEDTFRSFTFDDVEETYGLLDLWDEPAEVSTQALLAVCEHGTAAARFYGLAGLSQSDPWTFERVWRGYRGDDSHIEMLLGCFFYEGALDELFEEHVVSGELARGWRGVWSRTERSGAGFDRSLKPEYVAERQALRATGE